MNARTHLDVIMLIYVNNLYILRTEMVLRYCFSEQDKETSRMANNTLYSLNTSGHTKRQTHENIVGTFTHGVGICKLEYLTHVPISRRIDK